MKTIPALLLPLLTTLALPGQDAAKLKKELATKEAAAKRDPDALFAVGKWAAEHKLEGESKRIYEAVLKLAPNHEGANRSLGRELVEGKWVPVSEAETVRREAEKARRDALAAKFAAQGLVEVDGVWVEKDMVEKAKQGLYFHDGEGVTKEEKLQFVQGKVRHPRTGELIDGKELERAKQGYFPIGKEGRWVDEKEADKWHSDPDQPWVVRTAYCTLVSTHPLAKLEAMRNQADRAIEHLRPLFVGATTKPDQRPVILAASTLAEYVELGTRMGDGTDAAGAFLMRNEARLTLRDFGSVRAAICNMQDENGWGPYYLRHAAGLAYANGLAVEAGADLPLWLLHGLGSYCSRFENESDGGYFGKQHLAKGGVGDLASFFSGFTISGSMESKRIDYNEYQAGLMVDFAVHGGDAAVTAAMQGIGKALAEGKGSQVGNGIKQLEPALVAAKPAIVAHLEKLITKAP